MRHLLTCLSRYFGESVSTGLYEVGYSPFYYLLLVTVYLLIALSSFLLSLLLFTLGDSLLLLFTFGDSLPVNSTFLIPCSSYSASLASSTQIVPQ